ncbi:MAG: hypothetical protein IPI42_16500 [Saprospiraceae bacterium]|nr:hypothetical protein [Candidatus Parvibacillus calidus]
MESIYLGWRKWYDTMANNRRDRTNWMAMANLSWISVLTPTLMEAV